MKWILVNNVHINMDNIASFCWLKGDLHFHNGEKRLSVDDPDKKHYHKLCQQVGVRPYIPEETMNALQKIGQMAHGEEV